MARVLDLGSGEIRLSDVQDVALSIGGDGGMCVVLEGPALDLMVFNDPDPDLVIRVASGINDAIEQGHGRVVLADLVRAAQRGVLAE